MRLAELIDYTDGLLEAARYDDYGPNGLQVEGRGEVRRLVSGVSASLALVEAAIEAGADAILVHHGWFWRNEDRRITGLRKARIAALLRADVSLIGYHLPLDAHRTLGNNASLGRVLGIRPTGWFGEQSIGAHGALDVVMPLAALGRHVASRLARDPLLIGDPERPVRTVAWCTGGAQGWIDRAVALGVDCYLSGEISEHTVHVARETGVAYIAAGHHATERYGVQALGAHLAEQFGIEHRFIEIPNPV